MTHFYHYDCQNTLSYTNDVFKKNFKIIFLDFVTYVVLIPIIEFDNDRFYPEKTPKTADVVIEV